MTMSLPRNAHLTPTEWRIAAELVGANGAAVPLDDLARAALGYQHAAGPTLRTHVNNLRRKVGPETILRVRGYGYRWVS